MNKDFSRIITLLRKEKKLSQKEAASELGISQALLSHYEKGIRECGLDFVVKAAEYYNVSCDYLLGKTAERSFDDSELGSAVQIRNTASNVSRKLISSSMDIIYDQLARTGNRNLIRKVTAYLMISIYRVFRFLYSSSGKNDQEMFTVPIQLYSGYSAAAQDKLFTDIEAVGDINSERYISALEEIVLSPDVLAKEYPSQAAAIFNVIQQAENSINKIRR